MARIMAIDYGTKRVGIAVTDPLQIIAQPLETVPQSEIFDFLAGYISKEEVEKILVGLPLHADGSMSPMAELAQKFASDVAAKFPHIPVELVDERYTSRMAHRAMVEGGFKKKDRQKKENIDKLSAAILLQEYLGII